MKLPHSYVTNRNLRCESTTTISSAIFRREGVAPPASHPLHQSSASVTPASLCLDLCEGLRGAAYARCVEGCL